MNARTFITAAFAAILIVALIAALSLFKSEDQVSQPMQNDGAAAVDNSATSPAAYEVPRNIVEIAPPEQPLPYSHKIHAGTLGLECATCHVGADADSSEDGRLMTYPKTAVCIDCHRNIATDSPAIARLVDYSTANQSIPWKRVDKVLPGVTWSHQPHLDAGVPCETCHGDVRALDVMTQTKAIVAMATCISCHEANGAPATCQTCHAWPKDLRLSERKE